MISFGYKSSFNSFVRAAAAIGVGLIMVFGADKNAPVLVVKLIASLVIIAGLALLLYGLMKYGKPANPDIKTAEEVGRSDVSQSAARMRTVLILNAAIVLIVGVLLLLYPAVLAKFIITLIAIGLIVLGSIQLMMMTSIMSMLGTGFTSLILSILAVVGGAFLLFSHFGERTLGIIAGCILLVYGVSEAVSTFQFAKARKMASGSSSGDSSISGAREVDYVKVDGPAGDWGAGRVDDQTADE